MDICNDGVDPLTWNAIGSTLTGIYLHLSCAELL